MYILNSMGNMTFSGVRGNVRLPHNTSDIRPIMQDCAGNAFVLFEGGADINPDLYGEDNIYSACSDARDYREIVIFNYAKELNIPVLGICRGHQLLAALDGGSLYQDIRRQLGKSHNYNHYIDFSPRAAEIGFIDLMQSNPLGRPDIVNSMHHQGVKRMPAHGQILAVAPDGIVEAIEYPWGMSVQWHPEFMGHTEFVRYMAKRFLGEGYADYTAAPDGFRDRSPELV